MSGKAPKDERTSQQGGNLPQDPARREFLGGAAAMAAVVVGAPTLLAACDSDTGTGPESSRVTAPETVSASLTDEPWWTLHRKLAASVGSASDVQVPTLEKGDRGYLQRIVTDNDRTGTGLATILRSGYKFSTSAGTVYVTVSVQSSYGRAWPARTIYSQKDLVYAMRDALATNTLTDGVLEESLRDGNPVIAAVKASVVQFHDGVASDYYGNHLQVASRVFCDIFTPYVGNFRLGSTTRDLQRS